MFNNEMIRLLCPIFDIRAGYPDLISLETGVIVNLTPSNESENYDPINGPLVFTELGYPGLIAGVGGTFGRVSETGFTFVRPEICYARFWTNRFVFRNRGQYLGGGITGSFLLVKASLRIFHSIYSRNSKEYLPYVSLGFGF